MIKSISALVLIFSAAPVFADCASVATEAASLIAKLPRAEGGRGFVLVEGNQIVARDIGTDTYRISLQLNGERTVWNVSLNRRTCKVASVLRDDQP